ncbi:lasso peptide biosynthesis PqqD family chaperone [Actinoplanes sp. NPDC049596]|uniref:lasso peptide biosynthesis PqqD family chaperone n=1 Tax=unclassified Actinoplanes TaxID=2626549 RepID=UPI00341F90C8
MPIALPRDVTATESADGLVLLDQRNGMYWLLNGTGATTLRLILDGYSPAATAARLARDFPDASERITADVQSLLAALREAGLLEDA